MKKRRIDTNERFSRLVGMGERIFHISDFASLWGMTDKNTLYTTLKRYVKKGLLERLHNGMYAVPSSNRLNPYVLGIKGVHAYAYVSTETILFREGILSRPPEAITLVGTVSKRFSIAGQTYRCRKMRDEYIYQSEGIFFRDGVREASVDRAIADLLYYNPKTHFDAPVSWRRIRRMQRIIGFPVHT